MIWQLEQNFPILQPNQAHVWRASLTRAPKDIEKLYAFLNSIEKKRATNFIVEYAKNNFIIARATLRQLLANYLHTDPKILVLQQTKHGKLYLENSKLQFNISHSRNLGLFAFTLEHQIGVDIEWIRPNFEYIEIAKRFFSPQESQDLLALPQERQLLAFFNCWSRKEAIIKALGTGLFCELDQFSVEISAQKLGFFKTRFSDINMAAKNWTLETLDPHNEYVGAVAVQNANCNIYTYNHPDSQPVLP